MNHVEGKILDHTGKKVVTAATLIERGIRIFVSDSFDEDGYMPAKCISLNDGEAQELRRFLNQLYQDKQK